MSRRKRLVTADPALVTLVTRMCAVADPPLKQLTFLTDFFSPTRRHPTKPTVCIGVNGQRQSHNGPLTPMQLAAQATGFRPSGPSRVFAHGQGSAPKALAPSRAVTYTESCKKAQRPTPPLSGCAPMA